MSSLAPGDERHDECDELDFGVELEFESGRVVGVSWNADFWAYGIGIYEGGLQSTVQDATVFDASARAPWCNVRSAILQTAKVVWDAEGYEGSSPIEFPYRLELTFSHGPTVALAAAYYNATTRDVTPGGDSILVMTLRPSRGNDV